MSNAMGYLFLTGIGATLVTDLWCLVREQVFGVPMPNYAFVGRWIAHMARGRARHYSTAAAARVPAEAAVGWMTHYLVGIAFACLLPVVGGHEWICQPTLLPALLLGIGTVSAPFFVMQPAMGAGIAASRTPNPSRARLHSLAMHAVFGIGLYLAGTLVSWLIVRME